MHTYININKNKQLILTYKSNLFFYNANSPKVSAKLYTYT